MDKRMDFGPKTLKKQPLGAEKISEKMFYKGLKYL